MNKTTELCPYCNNEVELNAEFKAQVCPVCGKVILPCSLCDMDKADCANCPLKKMNKEEKIEIQLPFFDGFYESVYYNSDSIYDEFYNNEREYKETYGDDITDDDLDVRFDEYQKDVCEAFTECFSNLAPSFVTSVEFSEMTSPRYYNFETDKVYANITLSDDWREQVLTFMKENKDWLKKRIYDEWTSRDGFMSFMDNNYDEWLHRFENTEDEIDPRYLSTMIGYIMMTNNEDVHYDLIEGTLEDIYIGNYIYCTKGEDDA